MGTLQLTPAALPGDPKPMSRSTQQVRFAPLLLLFAACMVTTSARATAAPIFSSAFLSFDTGTNPTSVAVGDMNGDGKPDLVVPTHFMNVAILIGNGDGTFGAKADYAAGTHPYSVAIGDLNRDGKPDLAVANSMDNTASVLLGNGDGSFGAA